MHLKQTVEYDIHLQVAWRGAIFVGFCHRVMVDLSNAGGAPLAALLLVVVGLDDRPKPALPHHNHKWQITRESHACDSPPSFPLRQLIDPSCKRAHCTSYIAPIIVGTFFAQFFANDVKCKHEPGGLPTLGKAPILTQMGNDSPISFRGSVE